MPAPKDKDFTPSDPAGSALTAAQITNWKRVYPWMNGLSDFEIQQLRDMVQEKINADCKPQEPNAGEPPKEIDHAKD